MPSCFYIYGLMDVRSSGFVAAHLIAQPLPPAFALLIKERNITIFGTIIFLFELDKTTKAQSSL